MSKNIADYLHLYLGCQVIKGNEINSTRLDYTGLLAIQAYGYWGIIKPILRPLSSITEEEAIEVFKKVSLFDLSECQFEFGENYTYWINANLNGRVIDSINFVGDNIEMMNSDGTYSPLNPIATVLQYYLSKSFDIFNLHEQGLCLYKSDLK